MQVIQEEMSSEVLMTDPQRELKHHRRQQESNTTGMTDGALGATIDGHFAGGISSLKVM
jgi:hypothetical protein